MFFKRLSGNIDSIAFLYLGMCVVYFLEFIFCYVYSNFVFTHIIGIFVLAIIYRFREPFNHRSLVFVLSDILRALLFSAIAVAAVFLLDYAIYRYFGSPNSFFNISDNIFYYSYGYSLASLGKSDFILLCCLGVAVSAVQAIFAELFFRLQILNSLLSADLHPLLSNLIQAFFYGIWMTMQNLFLLLFFQFTPCIPYLILYFVFGFISGFALGLLAVSSRGIFACIVSSFIHYIMLNMIHFYSFSGNIYESSIIIIAYESIFLLIALGYYIVNRLLLAREELEYYYHVMNDYGPDQP